MLVLISKMNVGSKQNLELIRIRHSYYFRLEDLFSKSCAAEIIIYFFNFQVDISAGDELPPVP